MSWWNNRHLIKHNDYLACSNIIQYVTLASKNILSHIVYTASLSLLVIKVADQVYNKQVTWSETTYFRSRDQWILTPLPDKVAATILHDPFFVPVIRHTASADTRTLSVFIVKNTTFFWSGGEISWSHIIHILTNNGESSKY